MWLTTAWRSGTPIRMIEPFGTRTFRKVFGGGLPAAALIVLAIFVLLPSANAAPPGVVTGNVRVQLLSDSLVRIELKGPAGFEDRETFHVVNRDWPGTAFAVETNSGVVEIKTANYVVAIPQDAATARRRPRRVRRRTGALYLRRETGKQPVAARPGRPAAGVVVRRHTANGSAAVGTHAATPEPKPQIAKSRTAAGI